MPGWSFDDKNAKKLAGKASGHKGLPRDEKIPESRVRMWGPEPW